MISRRDALASGVAASLMAPAALAAAQPPTIEALTRGRTVLGASLSPDGKTLALLREARDAGKRIAFVSLVPTDNLKATPVRIVLGDLDVGGVSWASAERLLVSLTLEREQTYVPTGSHLGRDYDVRNRRMLSVGFDGREPVMLFGEDRPLLRVDPDLARVIDLLPDDPEHILIRGWELRNNTYSIYRMNVLTGRGEVVERGGPATYHWLSQDGAPTLRFDRAGRSTALLLARNAPGGEWTPIRKIRPENEFFRSDFRVVGWTGDRGEFLVVARAETEASLSLRAFDPRTRALGPPIASRPDRDVEDVLIDERGRLLATQFVADRNEYEFTDPNLAPHFRGIDRFFQGEASAELVDMDDSRQRLLVRASGPRVANAYYLYDVNVRRLEPLGLASPWLQFDSLAKAEALDVKTRDGAVIRAYLTQPLAEGPRPLAVLPHGGPESRDKIAFDVFAQAFAAQGWLVLQPNFRGSGGYGAAFADAGRGRWGDRMQEDVEDAVAQVLATGRADPSKVAICGASYGGYAALMGAVRRPDLYRCAVSIAGVSDLAAMLAFEREDGEDSPAYQYWVRTIGHPERDAEKLRLASPRRCAEAIKAPVLLIHGLEDQVVPMEQSRLMAQALRAAGKPVEHLEMKDVGHRGWTPETLRQIVERSAGFIAAQF